MELSDGRDLHELVAPTIKRTTLREGGLLNDWTADSDSDSESESDCMIFSPPDVPAPAETRDGAQPCELGDSGRHETKGPQMYWIE